jgi:AraC-like DNA-binding protein
MGESFNIVRQLEPPLDFIDERVIYIPPHRRLEVKNTELKIILAIDGEADLAIDGEPIGRVAAGDVLVVPRRCRQVYTPPHGREERLHVMRLFFDSAALGINFLATGTLRPEADAETSFRHYARTFLRSTLLLKGGQNATVRDMMSRIRNEAAAADNGYRFRVAAFCRVLVTEIVRLSGWRRAATAGRPADPVERDWVVEHTKEFLAERYDQPLSLSDIAAEVQLSPEHLARRFKRQTGRSVFEFLRELRIESSVALLLSSKLRVGEIAGRTGFSSAAVFCRNFQRAKGCSPLAFRRRGASRIAFQTTTLEPDNTEFTI